jgi:hypothetical protein
VTPEREIEALLVEIRALVLELHQLEGDGLDGLALSPHKAELRRLKSHLADLAGREATLVAA